MDGNSWIWPEVAKTENVLKCPEMSGKVEWLKQLDMAWNGLSWQEMAWKLFEIAGKD